VSRLGAIAPVCPSLLNLGTYQEISLFSNFAFQIPTCTTTSWSLRLKSKTEEYQGESRRRLTVAHCSAPDYAAEAKNLLSLIRGTA
jgi:hypothetical protein